MQPVMLLTCKAERGRGGLPLKCMTLCTCLAGAGLSSSSAFVCVAALALLAVFDAAHLTKTVRPRALCCAQSACQRPCHLPPAAHACWSLLWPIFRAAVCEIGFALTSYCTNFDVHTCMVQSPTSKAYIGRAGGRALHTQGGVGNPQTSAQHHIVETHLCITV